MTEYGGLFEAELRAFAHLEASIKESIAEQEDQIDRLHALYEAAIAPLVEAINAQQALLDQQREGLAEQIRQHIIQNGSEGLHHDIHHSRRSEPKFDKEAALAEAIRHNATDYIRVKHELDLIPLKKALRNHEISWIGVEWEEKLVVTFPKLGDLLLTD